MNSQMKIESLNNIIDFKNGKIAPKEDGNIPIYGGNGILGYTDKFNYENIVIIGRVGAYCGSVHIEKGKCWVSDNAIAGIHKHLDSNYYNYYLLKSLYLNKYQIGSSQPLLTQGILNLIEVKIHNDLNNQIEIGDFVSKIDTKIELNNKGNDSLEQMAKTLYDYWFVQFDFPDANGKPYKTSGGKMVWNAELNRYIPESWEVKTFSEWINNDKSGDWGKEQVEGNYTEKVYCIRGADINGLNGAGELKSPERYILEKNLHKTARVSLRA